MPFATTTTLPPLPPHTENRLGQVDTSSDKDFGHFDILQRPVVNLSYGNVEYPLKSRSTRSIGRIVPDLVQSQQSGMRYTVDDLPSIVGRGDSISAAVSNFQEEFHRRFQELFAMRPFEMQDAEIVDWNGLSQMVDVEKYRRSVPIRVRRFGLVNANASGRHHVKWEGATDAVSIDLKDFPAEFAGYKTGQPFEAIVLLDADGLQTIRVVDVVKKSALRRRTTENDQQFWEGLGSTADLPSTSWE